MTTLVIIQILNGLTIGLVLALVAIGLSIVMGLMRVINFAHGSFYMLGGYMCFVIVSSLGNFWFGLLVAAFACTIVGLLLFISIIKPLNQRPPFESLIALFGVSMIFRQLTRTIWGADPRLMPIPIEGAVKVNILGLSFTYPIYFLIVLLISVLFLISFYILFHKTDIGIRCLAAIQDRDTSLSLGVNVDRVGSLMFIIGTAVAGLAGGLVGPIFSVEPTMDIEIIGILFVIVIVGGMGSIGGAVIAGVLIAMTRSISGIFVSGSISEILAYCFLLAILLTRPRGIMGLKKVLE